MTNLRRSPGGRPIRAQAHASSTWRQAYDALRRRLASSVLLVLQVLGKV